MITFIDAQEAELWRATVAAWIASHREYTGDGDAIAGVAAIADDVVLEYRKRCGPGVIPESVDSFIRQAVNFADKVGSRAADDSIRGMASRLIENGEQLLAEGDE